MIDCLQCKYEAFNKYCGKIDCKECPQYIENCEAGIHCKCLIVDYNKECPYYKEVENDDL